jgi:hypothetical protein
VRTCTVSGPFAHAGSPSKHGAVLPLSVSSARGSSEEGGAEETFNRAAHQPRLQWSIEELEAVLVGLLQPGHLPGLNGVYLLSVSSLDFTVRPNHLLQTSCDFSINKYTPR